MISKIKTHPINLLVNSVPTLTRLSIPHQVEYRYGVGIPAKKAKYVDKRFVIRN
ncbi:MAG: hypothetical protein HC849_19470 [Oscillatoriales cyanobacterium RU_3_3]|nr:hypothetical protein [Oscillatoriales cyanobacterium RU_3_3]